MTDPTPVSTIAHFIQLSIAPVFLLAGIGAILNVMANRLARVVDRVRHLEADFASESEEEQLYARMELRRLGSRMKLVNWSITCCTASALFVCLVVAIMFVGGLGAVHVGQPIAILFILAMALLIGGLILFLLEVRSAARTLRVRYELLGFVADARERSPPSRL
jgi:amino acid transporter